MQLETMECTGRSNLNEHDSELGDNMSHDDHSDDEMRNCDLVAGGNISRVGSHLNTTLSNNGAATVGDVNGPDHLNDISVNHHLQFPTSHPLNALGSFMGIGSLRGISNLQHTDVLEKLKMQVRDMKVSFMDQEYSAAHAVAFGSNVLPTPINTAFTLPPTTISSFPHAAQTLVPQGNNNLNSHLSGNSSSPLVGGLSMPNGSHNSFSFTSPIAPSAKDANPGSNSSTSSETSNSSQQNNSWSFEEQYKQVRQLYEINDDPKRKIFLDDLFSFMQKRGTPINRLPIMAKSVLDLYELYNLVIARGGLVDVINKKLWQEIIKGLNLPSSITSAAFTLRTQYMKYLYPYECEKKNLSTPAELQAAIDGNRREGRRSSYGQYEAMHNQMQMPQIGRQSMPGSMQQMSPLALVTHAANNQQAQVAAAAAAAHQRLMTPSFGQVPNLVTQEIEQRMIEYLKLIQVKKEQNSISNGCSTMVVSPHHQQRQRSQSPETSAREALNALEMSRVALWQMYHNNTSPPDSVNTSPQDGGNCGENHDVSGEQCSEALNLSDLAPNLSSIKREREHEPNLEINTHTDFHHQPPPAKRLGFPASFYFSSGMGGIPAAALAEKYHYKGDQIESDAEVDEVNDQDGRNTIANTLHDNPNERQYSISSSLRAPVCQGSSTSVQNYKSDDSAPENSSSNSASPVFIKKVQDSKQIQPLNRTVNSNIKGGTCSENMTRCNPISLSPFETLNLLSGMKFSVTPNGSNSNDEQELVINLEFNGVKYNGVLSANTSSIAMTTAKENTSLTSTAASIADNENVDKSHNIENNITNYDQNNDSHKNSSTNINNSNNDKSKDLVIAMGAIEDTSDLLKNNTETLSNTTTKTLETATTNQTNGTNVAKDALTTP